MSVRFEDLTVSSVSPFRVKRDGDEGALPYAPDTIINVNSLSAGDRVLSTWIGQRLIIIGKADGADTGWVPITPVSGYTASENLAYRVKNGVVYIRGAVVKSSGNFSNSTYEGVFTLPLEARIATYQRFAIASGVNPSGTSAFANVHTSGVVEVGVSGSPGWGTLRLSNITYPRG